MRPMGAEGSKPADGANGAAPAKVGVAAAMGNGGMPHATLLMKALESQQQKLTAIDNRLQQLEPLLAKVETLESQRQLGGIAADVDTQSQAGSEPGANAASRAARNAPSRRAGSEGSVTQPTRQTPANGRRAVGLRAAGKLVKTERALKGMGAKASSADLPSPRSDAPDEPDMTGAEDAQARVRASRRGKPPPEPRGRRQHPTHGMRAFKQPAGRPRDKGARPQPPGGPRGNRRNGRNGAIVSTAVLDFSEADRALAAFTGSAKNKIPGAGTSFHRHRVHSCRRLAAALPIRRLHSLADFDFRCLLLTDGRPSQTLRTALVVHEGDGGGRRGRRLLWPAAAQRSRTRVRRFGRRHGWWKCKTARSGVVATEGRQRETRRGKRGTRG